MRNWDETSEVSGGENLFFLCEACEKSVTK